MSNVKRFKLAEVVAEVREKHPQIEVETEDGQVFTFDPVQLWPDEAIEALANPLASGLDLAIAVLGQEEYERFKAAGGTAALFNRILDMSREGQSATLGESLASAVS